MAAKINPISWAALYKSNRDDGGAIHNLFVYKDDELAVITKNRLEFTNGFMTTITSISRANILFVPSVHKIFVEVIHQGFTSSLPPPSR
jgi:hypothetical protein